MPSKVGRASVPPEGLLKACIFSLYSMRSERDICKVFEYNLLLRWFLDMNLMERGFGLTVFTKNRRRLVRCWGRDEVDKCWNFRAHREDQDRSCS